MKPLENIQELHQTYCRLSGMNVALRFNRESSWVYFTQAGFTKEDLEAVLQRLLKLVKLGDRRPECLKFSNVVEGLDRFEEELAMIKAEQNGLVQVQQKLSVTELHRIKEAKQAILADLKFKHASEDAFGLNWETPEFASQAAALRREIFQLIKAIADVPV